MKNILIIDNSEYLTGANKSISKFAKALAGSCKFHWAVTKAISKDDLSELVGSDIVRRFKYIEISRSFSAAVFYFPQLIFNTLGILRMVKEHNISIVHVNDCYNMCGVLIKIMNRKVKVVYHVRLLRSSYIGPLYSSFINAIKRYSDAVVCCSNAVSNDVGDLSNKTVIYDSEFFDEADDEVFRVRPQAERIVYVGNILPGKGQDWAIRAFALVQKDFPQVRLYFVGKYGHNDVSASFKSRLDLLIAETRLGEKVVFEGFKADVEEELRKADIMLNLSESESFSMVCLEALKTGVPLIASDCGGPTELFEHMQSGWLVENKDHIEAAEATAVLLANPELREQFSVESKMFAKRKFNVSANSRILDSLYDRALSK